MTGSRQPPAGTQSRPMSRYEHWVVAVSVRHNDAIKAALLGAPDSGGRTPADVSRLSVLLYSTLHTIRPLLEKYGVAGTFGTPGLPLSQEERDEIGRLPLG